MQDKKVDAREILVVGRNPHIMSKVKGLLESAGFVAQGSFSDNEAIALMQSTSIAALLLGGGVEPASRQLLIQAFHAAKPGAPVIEHVGGPDGLLDHVQRVLGSA